MPNRARLITQIWKAVRELNPQNVAQEAGRQVCVGVVAPLELLQDTAAFLLGEQEEAYDRAADSLLLVSSPPEPGALALLAKCDVVLVAEDYEGALTGVPAARVFKYASKDALPEVVRQVVKQRGLEYAHLPLARLFPAFRTEAAVNTIQTVSIENAIFVVSTSLGNVIPNPLQPLASVAESLGDLVVLTANQLRMLYRLAAIYRRELGVKQQAPEALSVLGAAFGWRSAARELVGKIPFGGGIVPKAAIAFAGTWAVGEGIAFYYTTGRRMTNTELKERFGMAMSKGREWGERLAGRMKSADDVVARLRDAYSRGAGKSSGGAGQGPAQRGSE